MSKPEWQSSEYTTLAALSTLSWWRASSCTSVLIPKPMRKAPLKSATCRPPMCILLQNLQMLSHKLSPVRHYTISCVRRRSPGPSEVSRSLSFFFVRARPSAYRRGFAFYINSLRSFFDRLACFSVKSNLFSTPYSRYAIQDFGCCCRCVRLGCRKQYVPSLLDLGGKFSQICQIWPICSKS